MSEVFSTEAARRACLLLDKTRAYLTFEDMISEATHCDDSFLGMIEDLGAIKLATPGPQEGMCSRQKEIVEHNRKVGLSLLGHSGILSEKDAMEMMDRVEPKLERWEKGLALIENEARIAIAKLHKDVFGE